MYLIMMVPKNHPAPGRAPDADVQATLVYHPQGSRSVTTVATWCKLIKHPHPRDVRPEGSDREGGLLTLQHQVPQGTGNYPMFFLDVLLP